MESLNRFKQLSYAKYLYTDGRIILVDVPLEPRAKEAMGCLKTVDGKELVFLETEQLAMDLERFLEELVGGEKNILFVFPGNGSNYPKSVSRICQEATGVGVFAKRIWTPGSDPFAVAGSIMPEVFLNLFVQTIVVVDDVISSGQTMYRLHRNNEWRFPRAKWIAATWVAQIPQMKARSGVSGYDRSVVACIVEGPNKRRVPINSLSTLREQPVITENYAKRYFLDASAFLRFISS
ncbi:MAG: hypothetical protein A2998_00370 [Candidatus Staskawiczbacteria bacterium RIFCSPLOWO2_01_FULL_37_25b]|uniref:Phosphoribosyltransferase domain-containing protein n=2 Tax=Candidatus Staskawicziibacteriota TaxID=1817916 RepID=A0A1G2HP14_9BACT|nr:MAG: hypothetical protein A2812_03500 [Candidatus Staskawiczbacteria bacterium RIFCSPHIGHO2_01_FULL_36_16]OGZ71677.1 MAG: hypothetical protein A2998_00370 [Candidatus Staskawiczbacteria bacterium RIFCSPLOWO2_01_FULL_37_25b]